MLDLNPRIDLDEGDLFAAHQELERARATVADGPRAGHRVFGQPVRHARSQAWCRRLLDQLLATALHRAIALPEVHHVAVRVGQDLDLDVPRSAEVSLQVDPIVTECGLGCCPGGPEAGQQPGPVGHHRHAQPASAGRCFDDQRQAYPVGRLGQFLRGGDHGAGAGHDGQADFGHQPSHH